MQITNPHQAYVDQRRFEGYQNFLGSLHKCLKCGGLFDDSENMSNDIDICKDCAGPKAAPPPEVQALTGALDRTNKALEIKKHLKQGEQ